MMIMKHCHVVQIPHVKEILTRFEAKTTTVEVKHLHCYWVAQHKTFFKSVKFSRLTYAQSLPQQDRPQATSSSSSVLKLDLKLEHKVDNDLSSYRNIFVNQTGVTKLDPFELKLSEKWHSLTGIWLRSHRRGYNEIEDATTSSDALGISIYHSTSASQYLQRKRILHGKYTYLLTTASNSMKRILFFSCRLQSLLVSVIVLSMDLVTKAAC